MKTQLLVTQNSTLKTFSVIGIILLAMLFSTTSYSQEKLITSTEKTTSERTIKGLVSDEEKPLEGVNVILKDTKNGTVTNEKGEFTFPKKLKTGDILLFSYLGYETQEIKNKEDTNFITLKLTAELIEMIGALDSNKPYKSKRKN